MLTRGRVTRTVTRRKRIIKTVTVRKHIVTVEDVYVSFGAVVRAIRQAKGITQEDVAKKIGLGRPSVVNIEQGRQRVLLLDVFLFAQALGVNPLAIFSKLDA